MNRFKIRWWLPVLLSTVAMTSVYTGRQEYPQPPTIQQLWNVREKAVYEIKYSFFRLGTITVEILPDSMYNGKYVRYLRAVIRSNPGIPFVGHEEDHFSSLMTHNDSIPYELMYWKDDIDEHLPKEDLYVLDYHAGKVYAFKRDKKDRQKVKKDTLALDAPSICGPGMFYYSRLYAGTDRHIKVPIYLNQKKNYLTMEFSRKTVMINSSAFPGGKVLTYTSEGDADFNGPFGFRGHFKAWFATDSLRIPVEAHLRVWLGNVKVKLIKYTVL